MNALKKGMVFLGMLGFAMSIASCDRSDDVSESASPDITAGMVKDKESLSKFVLQAKAHLEKDYEKALADFKTDEKWIKGSIYLFVSDMEGLNIFHPVKPELEGQSTIDLRDSNGIWIVKELIESAKTGGKYVDYLWDNPEIPGEDSSPKTSYTLSFKKDGEDLIVGSGFYPSP